MFQYQTEYGCNSGESAIKEVKVRRKDKVNERTIKSKSEEETTYRERMRYKISNLRK